MKDLILKILGKEVNIDLHKELLEDLLKLDLPDNFFEKKFLNILETIAGEYFSNLKEKSLDFFEQNEICKPKPNKPNSEIDYNIFRKINDLVHKKVNKIIIASEKDSIQKIIFDDVGEINKNIEIIINKNSCGHLILEIEDISKDINNISIVIESDENSKFSLTLNQYNTKWGVFNIETRQKSNSTISIHTYTGGDSRVLNYINSYLEGENSKIELFGAIKGEEKSLIGNKIKVFHRNKFTSSFQFYKNIVGGESEVLFDGAIDVIKNGKKTEAYQKNDSIITSSRGIFHSRPILSIFEDDVKCSHGATIGRIDKNQVFYLCSRGFSKKEAETLLVSSFLDNIFQKNNKSALDYLLASSANSIIDSINSTGL